MPRINMYEIYRKDNRLLDKTLALELEYQKQVRRNKYKEILSNFLIIMFFLVVTLLSSYILAN